MRILITGGAGFIGSHTLIELVEEGHAAHVLDNLSNARPEGLARIAAFTGRSFEFTRADLRDEAALRGVVHRAAPEAVVHFAGLKAVGESVRDPLAYYDNNVGGTLMLIRALKASPCRRLVFSSSATVYGAPQRLPIDEAHPLRPASPYGQSKLMVETMLADLAASDPRWSIACLRYFNPVGAHPSGRFGEDPTGVPNNLMPYLAQVALGRRPELVVHGTDYPTPDGSGIRDYLHVVDLARAHLAALRWTGRSRGCEAFNLGTGRGSSVLEMVAAFERASGRRIPLHIGPRRPGDVAASYADPSRAGQALGWRAERSVEAMCASTWAWARANPQGYRTEPGAVTE